MNTIPVVMDCDPGTDDALAILMMFAAPDMDVRAITTVAGNQNIQKNTSNALKITDYFSLDVPVAQGSYPLMKEFEAAPEWINGASGLGSAVLPETGRKAVRETAVEVLYREAVLAQGKLNILATGPLSNIALLLREHPDARTLIERITLMGGACNGGNATPCAEFNIYTDPEAAQIVFRSGVPVTMVGLDACYKTPLTEGALAQLYALRTRTSDFVCGLMNYPNEPVPAQGMVMFDALAAAALIDPTIIEGRALAVDVETKGEFTTGKTLVDVDGLWHRSPNALVAFGSNRGRFWQLVQKTVRYYDEKSGT